MRCSAQSDTESQLLSTYVYMEIPLSIWEKTKKCKSEQFFCCKFRQVNVCSGWPVHCFQLALLYQLEFQEVLHKILLPSTSLEKLLRSCGLTICLWLSPSWFNYWFYLLWHTKELTMSTRLCLSLWLIWFLCFRFDALTELGTSMRIDFFYVFLY